VRVVEVVHGLGKRLLGHMGLELNVNDLACCHWSARASDVVLRMSSHVTVMLLRPGASAPFTSPLAVLAQGVVIESGSPLLMILC
jgi:hypothetical protein